MSKHFFSLSAFALVFFLSPKLNAQDLIVKHNGDSIICTITKVDKVFINYYHMDEFSTHSERLELSEVVYFKYRYLEEGSMRIMGRSYADVKSKSSVSPPYFRIAGSIGAGYQLGRIESDGNQLVEEYLRGLKWGLTYNLDLHIYIDEQFGLGAKFSHFQTDNSLDNVALIDSSGNVIGVGTVSDNIGITFIGPSGTFRKRDEISGNSIIVNAFIGYMGYLNEGLLIDPFKIEGSTLGIGFEAGYDFKIEGDVSMGIQLSVYTGSLASINITDQNGSRSVNFEEPEEFIGLQRVELTVGLRFGN